MGTGICRTLPAPLVAVLLALVACLACSGCGVDARGSAKRTSATASALAALHPQAAPRGWRDARTSTGAVLHYPPSWRWSRGDTGSATAILPGHSQHLLGYLNATPRQGAETLADWASFRVRHNVREGDSSVVTEAVASAVPFRNGSATCVRDRYRTSIRARYIEIACLVRGAIATSVIVAAAPPSAWARVSPDLYRALSAFTT
jgi:hypothetical protein